MPTIEILAKGTSITDVTTTNLDTSVTSVKVAQRPCSCTATTHCDSEFTIQSTEYVDSPHDDVLLFLCNSQSQLDQLHALKVRVQ